MVGSFFQNEFSRPQNEYDPSTGVYGAKNVSRFGSN
jgi:hypothetical protein